MIETFEGRLGGGKTYTAVTRAMDVWRRGGTVFANIEFHWAACIAFALRRFGVVLNREQWVELTNEQIIEFHKHTAPGTAELPTLTIIDEAHIHLGVLEHGRGAIKPLFDYLTQSRKQNSDVIFITQNAKNIDGRIARLVQFIWRFRDLEKWKIPGLGPFPALVKMLTLGLRDGRMLLQVCFDYDGKTINEKRWCQKDREIFALYNTNALLSPIPRLEKTTTFQLDRVKKKGWFMAWIKWTIPALLLLGGFSVYKLIGYVGDWKAGKGPGSKSAIATPASLAIASKTPAQTSSTPAAAGVYDLETEKWLAIGPGYMRLESGFYQVGRLSKRGFVQAIQDQTVKIAKPDGKTLYIVGVDYTVPAGTAVVSNTPATHRDIIIAPHVPMKLEGAGATWNNTGK